MKSRVAIVAARPERVLEDYDRLFRLLGQDFAPPVQDGLLLVLDCPSAYFIPGASSPPWQLDGAVGALTAAGYAPGDLVPVIAGDRDAQATGRHCRYQRVLRARDLELRTLAGEPARLLRPRTRLRRLARFFPDGIPVARLLVGRDALLLPTLRGDRREPAGGAVAVAPTAVVQRRLPPAWCDEAEVRADVLALRRELHPRLAALLDLTVVGFGAKIGSLQSVAVHLLLASTDPVALDAVAVRLLGYDPLAVDYLRACHERSLGTALPGEITLLGQPELLANGPRFCDPARARMAPTADFRRQLTPLLQTLPAAGRFDRWRRHAADRMMWLGYGRRRLRRFAASPWGRLFDSYADPRKAEGTA